MQAELNKLGEQIIGAAMKVHTALGAGLLESAYEICLAHELTKLGFRIERQLALPIVYDGIKLDCAYRLDIVVEKMVVLELKATDKLQAIHSAQLISYLKLGNYPLGYLFNFNSIHLRDGIQRLANTKP